MLDRNFTAPVQDLLLLGGGHTHALLLLQLARHPLPGTRLTLVTASPKLAYSGMLPGHVAGRYAEDDLYIDLRKLAVKARAALVVGEVDALDAATKRIGLVGGQTLPYDLCSLNVGGEPRPLPGTESFAVASKPTSSLLAEIRRIDAAARAGVRRIAIVGGGAGGVELALAVARRFAGKATVTLICGTRVLVPTFPDAARRHLTSALLHQGVELKLGAPVIQAERDRLTLQNDGTVPFDHLLWVTGVRAPRWLERSRLTLNGEGFVLVDDFLRSVSHPEVFAVGDVAVMQGHPRARAGVFAVRASAPLEANLRAVCSGTPLRRQEPQRHFLSLIGTAESRAVAVRGPFVAEGRWISLLKDFIDRSFVARFSRT